jgi:uncharacterized protein
MTAKDWINYLQLIPHVEGGAYRENYRAGITLPANDFSINNPGNRNICTSIYFLLQQGECSLFHRIKSDEIWYFHDGGVLLIYEIKPAGELFTWSLGKNIARGNQPQVIISAKSWFAAVPSPETVFCLAGCMVSPGFDFADFELGKRENLIRQYPQHQGIIEKLTLAKK